MGEGLKAFSCPASGMGQVTISVISSLRVAGGACAFIDVGMDEEGVLVRRVCKQLEPCEERHIAKRTGVSDANRGTLDVSWA